MRAPGTLPDSVAIFRKPRLMRNSPAAHRFGSEVWPSHGCPGFLHHIEGQDLLALWWASWTASIAVDLGNFMGFVGWMHHRHTNQFWNQHTHHVSLDARQACWTLAAYQVLSNATPDSPDASRWPP